MTSASDSLTQQKNLGVVLDSELSFEAHVNKVVKTCFLFIRKLYSIKQFLSQEHLKSLVLSFIFSRLDYCNALFYGLNTSTIQKLQRVQNSPHFKKGQPQLLVNCLCWLSLAEIETENLIQNCLDSAQMSAWSSTWYNSWYVELCWFWPRNEIARNKGEITIRGLVIWTCCSKTLELPSVQHTLSSQNWWLYESIEVLSFNQGWTLYWINQNAMILMFC